MTYYINQPTNTTTELELRSKMREQELSKISAESEFKL